MLRLGKHQPRLQAAWHKYGDRLIFSILLVCSKADLLFYEQRAADVLKPQYNFGKTVAKSQLGVKWSLEQKLKLRALRQAPGARAAAKKLALMRGPLTTEHKAKISASLRKPESVKVRRAANLGRKASEETKRKLSVARLGNQNSVGCWHSSITKYKMGASHRERTRLRKFVDILGVLSFGA